MTSCPFCSNDLADIHAATISARNLEAVDVCMCCDECGEPIFATATGYRKPTDIEYASIIARPEVSWARAVHLEKKNYKNPFTKIWHDFERQLRKRITEKSPNGVDIGVEYSKGLYILGLQTALRYFKDLHNANLDPDIEAARVFLMETEIVAMRDRLAGKIDEIIFHD